jgi:NOL1/NOP2/fmu family ribosome biogenesis protein
MDKFGAEAVDLDPDPNWNIAGSLTDDKIPVYHFMQHRTRGEGFFLCLLRKPEGPQVALKGRPFKADSSKIPAECKTWITDGYEFYIKNESVYALPSDLKDDMWQAGQELYALVPGIEVAVMKGRDWVPAHALAMSSALNRDAFNRVEVSRLQALAYLHCDAIRLEDAPRGVVLLTYKDIPLGFAKNIGNRANNMYPQEWRIRNSIS